MAATVWVIILAQSLMVAAAAPLPSITPTFHEVDVIVINQYNRQSMLHDGTSQVSVVFYISFWNIHELPTGTAGRMPVWEYRGWSRDQPLLPCDGGWVCRIDHDFVVAPRVLYIVSDYDFEYCNRHLSWGRLVTGR